MRRPPRSNTHGKLKTLTQTNRKHEAWFRKLEHSRIIFVVLAPTAQGKLLSVSSAFCRRPLIQDEPYAMDFPKVKVAHPRRRKRQRENEAGGDQAGGVSAVAAEAGSDGSGLEGSQAAAARQAGMCTNVGMYERVAAIGSGTYGTVFKARHKSTGRLVALKQVALHHEAAEGFPQTALREIRALRRLGQHKHIAKLLEVAVGKSREQVFLVFEYASVDLAAFVDARPQSPFSEGEVKTILWQLLSALQHCHRHWIMHRDLKLSNVLYHEGNVYLADFGLARSFACPPAASTAGVVTLWYRAPEILLGGTHYGPSADLWSAGCILGELLLGQPLLAGQTDAQQFALMVELLGWPGSMWPGWRELPAAQALSSGIHASDFARDVLQEAFSHISPAGLDLLHHLLDWDPAQRISAKEALAHAYFREAPLPVPPENMPTSVSAADRATTGKDLVHSVKARRC